MKKNTVFRRGRRYKRLRMKQFAWLPILFFCVSCSTVTEQPKKPDPVVTKPVAIKQPESDSTDLRRFSGGYSYNFSCTDEDAHVHVRFYKTDHPLCPWRADGEMYDHIRERQVSFKGAFATQAEDGSVTVSSQFVDFKIVGTELFWLPSYDQSLTKQ